MRGLIGAVLLYGLVALCLLACAAPATWAQGRSDSLLAISNEFIRIRVNSGPEEAGRFAVDTTGGDPSRSSDDNQVLIYGSSDPWTSYTTVWVDGAPHVFGGPTGRRAGLNQLTGTLLQAPTVAEGEIICVARIGDIEVTQELDSSRSLTTRVKDAARIAYHLTNRGEVSHRVGLRILLDTMLGSNDGAPLRAGDRAITTAVDLSGEEVPEYWQAFDSLSQPTVISQGTLAAPGLSPPDRVVMADWGTLADAPWEVNVSAGADFTRRGEEAQDTAVALYWDPTALAPGESRTCAAMYGVGGVSLSPAELSLGLTAPAEVDHQSEEARPFSIIAYLENSGGFEARGVVLTLELPDGLKLSEGRLAVEVGRLAPGQTRQASWKVLSTGDPMGQLQIALTATSENLEPNRVVREIIVNSPPQLSLQLSAPEELAITPENRYSPNPFVVRVSVSNRGAQPGRNLVVSLTLPRGLRLAEESAAIQVAELLQASQTLSFTWTVRVLGLPTGRLRLSARASAAGARPAVGHCAVHVPELTAEVLVHPAQQTVPATTDERPTLVPVAVKLIPARGLRGALFSLSYDPGVVEPLFVSRGEAFVDAGRLLSPWSAGQHHHGRLIDIGGRRGEALPLDAAEVTLCTIVFMVKAPGRTAVALERVALSGAEEGKIECRVVNGHITVQAMEEER